ncbi:hypothetical protein AB4Y87_07825 [Paenarthrobacter sp. RAF54_2]|uniref:hypothetical protein n=1 Tax=Paenarthrobacter sp. RAF54_2 TaxID=3233061 RepID=UPI003F95215E
MAAASLLWLPANVRCLLSHVRSLTAARRCPLLPAAARQASYCKAAPIEKQA